MKFWGLFGMVALIPYTTEQNFVIGPFAKMDTSHRLRHIFDISQPISTFTQQYFNHMYFLAHTYSLSISHFSYESLGIHYQMYSTTRKNSHLTRCTSSVGVMRYLNPFQLSLHKIIIMTTSLYIFLMPHFTFSMENLGQRKGSHGTRKRTDLPGECHFMSTQ